VGLDRGLAALERATVEGPDDPDALCDHIIESLFAERSPNDDVAVLVLRTVALHGNRLELELMADPDAQRTMRRTVGRWLDRAGVVPEEANEVQVACHEVCSNAIEHGHRFGDDVVRIEAELDGDLLAMTVIDTGTWREERVTDRGRGLSMARAFMDTVDVDTGPEGTRVSMTRRVTFVSGNGSGAAPAAAKKKAAPRRKRTASGKSSR
jgi:anti-sigma regulatory factor (Ser/Thr protein kinase)